MRRRCIATRLRRWRRAPRGRRSSERSSEAARLLAAEVIETTLSEVGRSFSETRRAPAEIEAFADALASMMCAYLERLIAER